MKNNPKISVIVPVYNVEKYLSKCIESILAQTYTNFELLLIDDGSQDSSGRICDEYASKDSRIRVFHQKNSGVSVARNLGLVESRGEWISFIDSDDMIVRNTYQLCSNFFVGYDIIRFSFLLNYTRNSQILELDTSDDLVNYTQKIIARRGILGVCCGLFRKKLFQDNKIIFNKSLISGEDWLVQLQLLLETKSIKIINEPLYIYERNNESSTTSNFRFEVHYSALKALRMIENHINKKSLLGLYSKYIKLAETDLVYDFIASKLARNRAVKHSDMLRYKESVTLKFHDIFKTEISFKRKLLLAVYLSPLSKIIFYK
ncbi:MAG: glycosyltransferase [Duncaniella sp.]|uniref:glycosyltransferase n=1 Tax=Duncaniella sp. TaxID=2518496 RepID=UPI0023D5847E|nr:glycosyltransferase [Duncaniella sp.]MDE6091301.1 glycosyltransferase [Duncaniella sp.]